MGTGKVDAICDDGNLQTEQTLQIAYTEPTVYAGIFAFVRMDDTRFTDQNNRINQPDIRVSMIDGDLSHESLRKLYIKARLYYALALAVTSANKAVH